VSNTAFSSFGSSWLNIIPEIKNIIEMEFHVSARQYWECHSKFAIIISPHNISNSLFSNHSIIWCYAVLRPVYCVIKSKILRTGQYNTLKFIRQMVIFKPNCY
jgi:hypothetical protein